MKEFGSYLGFPIFLLVSAWGGINALIEVVVIHNRIRDFVLGISTDAFMSEGQRVPSDVRMRIFYSDWVPIWIGLLLASGVFVAVFLMIPPLFRAMHREITGDEAAWAQALTRKVVLRLSHLQIACFGFGSVGAVTFLAILVGGILDWRNVVITVGHP